jgi:hypothetical protein
VLNRPGCAEMHSPSQVYQLDWKGAVMFVD